MKGFLIGCTCVLCINLYEIMNLIIINLVGVSCYCTTSAIQKHQTDNIDFLNLQMLYDNCADTDAEAMFKASRVSSK